MVDKQITLRSQDFLIENISLSILLASLSFSFHRFVQCLALVLKVLHTSEWILLMAWVVTILQTCGTILLFLVCSQSVLGFGKLFDLNA